MSPCYLLPETKYILCGPGWDLCWTSLDSLMYVSFPCCFCSFLIVTNFSLEYNLMSLLSPPSKIINLGGCGNAKQGNYVWFGGRESTIFIKKLLTIWCKCLTFFSMHTPTHILTITKTVTIIIHTSYSIYLGHLSVPVQRDLSHCVKVKFQSWGSTTQKILV